MVDIYRLTAAMAGKRWFDAKSCPVIFILGNAVALIIALLVAADLKAPGAHQIFVNKVYPAVPAGFALMKIVLEITFMERIRTTMALELVQRIYLQEARKLDEEIAAFRTQAHNLAKRLAHVCLSPLDSIDQLEINLWLHFRIAWSR